MMKSKITKAEISIIAKGHGMDGKIVIKNNKYHRVIPAVFFSSKEADVLLRMVDKVESDRLNEPFY